MNAFPDIPLALSLLFVAGGFALLAWSANLFIDGAASLARALGISPLIVGMVVIGFGTSAPELFVSALSGITGHSELSLGNAYGSCIFNIAGILGVAALIRPLAVKPSVAWVAAPILVGISVLSGLLVTDAAGFTRSDGFILLGVFAVLLPFYCWYDQRSKGAKDADDSSACADEPKIGAALFKLLVGLVVLVGSSHVLVWGSVDLARVMGVSELMIGLTVVAVGTSLPELASAIAAARKGEHEFVLGNIVGSNLFNVLAVVGFAGSLSPFGKVAPTVLSRDMPVLLALSASILLFGANWRTVRSPGVVGRWKGALWIAILIAYLVTTIVQEGGFAAK